MLGVEYGVFRTESLNVMRSFARCDCCIVVVNHEAAMLQGLRDRTIFTHHRRIVAGRMPETLVGLHRGGVDAGMEGSPARWIR